MSKRMSWTLIVLGMVGMVVGAIGMSRSAQSHEVHGVTVLRGTDEVHVIGPPRSSLPKPRAATRSTTKGFARTIGGRRR